MGTFLNKNSRVFLMVSMFAFLVILAAPAKAVDVCGQPVAYIFAPDSADIDCETGDINVLGGTANLLTGGSVGSLYGLGDSTINIHGGAVSGVLNFGSTDIVTVYASAVVPIPGILEAGQPQIINSGADPLAFDLVGTYQDQTPLAISCILESKAVLNLNVPQTAPEIDVLPALLEWDLGEVEVGQSATMLVQIFNIGTADLNVSSVTLTGDAPFDLSSGPATPLVIAPSTSLGVDYEVTFTPLGEGEFNALVEVVSDDVDEPNVVVTVKGTGIITEVQPSLQIQAILDFFDDAVAIGTIQGYGPGNSPEKRLNALRNIIGSASDMINSGAYDLAIEQLQAISKKTDGISKPQDFVVGEAVAELNAMVEALIADLAS